MRVFFPCRRALLGGVALSFLSLSWGCTNAPATEEGGNARFDAAPPSIVEEGGCTAAEDAGSSAWSALYADYFGPSGVASCAGTAGQCHGETSGLGYKASGYLCAGGVTGCYQGITSTAAQLVTVGDTTDAPTSTLLYTTLRSTCNGSGTMPKEPASFVFSATDMARITDWIGAGAPDN